jgi:hypothetical protein
VAPGTTARGDAASPRHRHHRRRGGNAGAAGGAGLNAGAATSEGATAAVDRQLVINLAAQMERNTFEKRFSKVADLFEAFIHKGRAAAAAALDAAAAEPAPAATAGTGAADASAETALEAEQQQQQRKRLVSGAGSWAAQTLPPAPGYQPDRRCFSMYFRAVKNMSLATDRAARSLDQVQAMVELEAWLHGGAGPTRDALGALLCVTGASAGERGYNSARRALELFEQLRAAGGDVFFPFWRIAIHAALLDGQVKRAAE